MKMDREYQLSRLKPYTPPEWAKHLAVIPSHYVELANTPSAIEDWRLPQGLVPEGFKVLVKRDDRTGFGLSGNKVRKLEFLLADAIQQEADCVITIGGVQSNHCRATACAAAKLGLGSYLILRQADAALEASEDPGLCGNLLVSRLVGAHLRMVSKTEYVKNGQVKLVATLAQQLEQQGRKPYKIAVGGSTVMGVWGYLQFVEELRMQMEAEQRVVSDIVVACGSGGSTAGIAIGLRLAGLDVRLHGVLVCDSKEYFYTHIQDTIDALGLPYKAQDLVVLHDEYKGKAYALSTDAELEVLRQVASSSAILADPVYTGKAICGLVGLAAEGKGKAFKGDHLLFVHTGGFFGLYDKEEQIANLLPKDTVSRLFPKL